MRSPTERETKLKSLSGLLSLLNKICLLPILNSEVASLCPNVKFSEENCMSFHGKRMKMHLLFYYFALNRIEQ